MHNPFLSTPKQVPGHGSVQFNLLPPSTPVLQTVTFQYPLKLVSPTPLTLDASSHNDRERIIHTLYMLTYGGGLLAGDEIFLTIDLTPQARLNLLTQGSTKIFKSPDRHLLSRQDTRITIHPGAALCYLPDPVQPFDTSCFQQTQIYDMLPVSSDEKERGSLCVLDWVTCGRAARGENWGFWRYSSKNEVYMISTDEAATEGTKEEEKQTNNSRRLLLRDNMILHVGAQEEHPGSIAQRMDGMGVLGTLILYGPLFEKLANFFMAEFKRLPRIGGRKWDSGSGDEEEITKADVERAARQRRETADGLLWSAAAVRGCVLVKFGAREVEGARKWLRSMLETEGTVVHQFGESSLMCLR